MRATSAATVKALPKLYSLAGEEYAQVRNEHFAYYSQSTHDPAIQVRILLTNGEREVHFARMAMR
jgi:hypothetical protein